MRVYFSTKMVAESGSSISPSAAKPAKVLSDWQKRGLEIDVARPQPLNKKDFCMAHDAKFVNSILNCEEANGFGSTADDVARSLPYTSGAMYAAAKYAIKHGVAAALCSGFHHAGWSNASGFCTFNGLMVAAFKLRQEGLAKKVGVLDLDMHYGNGTDQIIRHKKADKWIKHFTAGASFTRPEQAKMFLKTLPSVMKKTFKECDVILVQLGADPYVKDPLGGWLTMEQLAERDRIVFETAIAMGKPVAWNLAGGYSRDEAGEITPVLEIHAGSAMACIKAYGSKVGKAVA